MKHRQLKSTGPHYHEAINRTYPANIIEGDSAYQLELAIPGYTKDDITITIEDGYLCIAAQAKHTDNNYTYREWTPTALSRKWQIGDGIDASSVSASMRDGILQISLSKVPEQAPVTIAIK